MNPSQEPSQSQEAGATSAASAGAMAGGPSLEDLSPEQQAQAAELVARMAEVQKQILSAPAEQFVVNHAMGLYELAAVHLAQDSPDLAQARLAIDALVGLMDATDDRLGEAESDLRAALSVLQTLYVRRASESND